MFQFGAEKPKPQYSINNKIRLIELFGGIGSQAMALRDIGADFEHYRLVEFDPNPVNTYNSIHHTNFKPMDITKINGEDLGIIDTDNYTYIMTYSFPCFTGDTLILSNRGYIPIKDIKVGDKVLSHSNEYKTVLCSSSTGIKDLMLVRGMGVEDLKCTENHKFYIREMYREKGHRLFKSPEWKECYKLTKNDYLGVAINQNSILPSWDGITFDWSDGRKSRYKNQISDLMETYSFWYIIGRYIGDGWTRNDGGIVICTKKGTELEITSHLDNCNLPYNTTKERTTTKIHICLKEFSKFVDQFGKYSYGKYIPGFMFDMPIEYLKGFIDGYVDADGYIKNGLTRVSSVSKELVYGLSQLVAKVYKTPYRINFVKRNPSVCIEGRKCNQRNSWVISWKDYTSNQDKAFYEDGHIWFPIREISKLDQQELVYDITVEDSHSFTANGVIVHNCTDLSQSGKRKGMERGSGTRSGLLWEVERLLNETLELPQVLVMENVTQIHGNQNLNAFNDWISFLKDKGYSSKYFDMVAYDYGVAQTRNRCFMVSLLGKYDFEIPKPVRTDKKLKDYLEPNVSEQYYVKHPKAEEMIQRLISEGKLKNGE